MTGESNPIAALIEYTGKKYESSKLQEFYNKFYPEFPYKAEGLDVQLHISNFVVWLIIEKRLPETGRTMLEDFVEEHPGLDEESRRNFLAMNNPVSSEFIVLSKNGQVLNIKDTKTQKRYAVKLPIPLQGVGANTMIMGRIYPFGSHYLLGGALGVYNSPMIMDTDIVMESYNNGRIAKAEGIILSGNTALTAILNKYPSQWIDGMCHAFSLDTKRRRNEKANMIAGHLKNNIQAITDALSEKSKSALRLVLKNNGLVRYNALKDYDDEIPFWWNNERPVSSIGVLRLKGLLAVGKMPQNGRMYKAALIPKDVREKLNEMRFGEDAHEEK
ncbi:MAG: hypothetical protein QME12_06380 [Nanoarchaeota archaeon]|nr:hypothetical protein [Nanoarchaeota archaeon]